MAKAGSVNPSSCFIVPLSRGQSLFNFEVVSNSFSPTEKKLLRGNRVQSKRGESECE